MRLKPMKPKFDRRLITVRKNLPNPNVPCWLADATAAAEMLRHALGMQITDMTPDGHLELLKRVEQHPIDITRESSPKTAAGLIRGLLADRPHVHRAGIICHLPSVTRQSRQKSGALVSSSDSESGLLRRWRRSRSQFLAPRMRRCHRGRNTTSPSGSHS